MNNRLKSNNSGKSNVINRISTEFKNWLDSMNNKREENGLDSLSYPKMTKLIASHKKCSKIIEDDIIHYNTSLDINREDLEFHER